MIRKSMMIAVLTATLLSSYDAFAQRYRERDADYFPRHEMYIQYGTPTLIEFVTMKDTRITDYDPVFEGEGESRNHKFTGVAGLGYNFFTTEKLSFGAYLGYSWTQADIYATKISGVPTNEFLYTSSMNNWCITAASSLIWWQQGSMELSSGVYLGVDIINESLSDVKRQGIDEADNRVKFAYHLTAAKFRWGETVGGFAELGFGYRGILNVGLSVKL